MPDQAQLIDEAFEALRSRGRTGLASPEPRRAVGELVALLHARIAAQAD